MPIKLTKPAGAGAAPSQPKAPASAPPSTGTAAPGASFSLPKPPPASHLITGEAQRTQIEQIKAQQALRERLRGGARLFYLEPGQFARLYFLDGVLQSNGMFDTPMVATHMLQIGGDWVQFVCNMHTEKSCIVCSSNTDRSQPTSLQLFTVINTTPYTIQNGKNKGKVLQARLQLLAVTVKTLERLTMKAQAKGGRLEGKLFQFSRASNQDPRVGSDIEYMQDVPMQQVIAKYPKLGDNDTPTGIINYNTAFPILSNAELAQLRPDIAHAAGYAGAVYTAPGMQHSSVGDIGDDEIPF